MTTKERLSVQLGKVADIDNDIAVALTDLSAYLENVNYELEHIIAKYEDETKPIKAHARNTSMAIMKALDKASDTIHGLIYGDINE